jgi:anaerobic selenocysteine-containing dehydrogenase
VNLAVPELLDLLRALPATPPTRDAAYPFVLSAGERRTSTANTIFRDPAWRTKDRDGALRVSPDDARGLGVTDGDRVRVTTRRGSAEAVVEVSTTMRAGHVSLPNGTGVGGVGVSPNELTSGGDRDPIAGTPWHKHVPARIERVA